MADWFYYNESNEKIGHVTGAVYGLATPLPLPLELSVETKLPSVAVSIAENPAVPLMEKDPFSAFLAGVDEATPPVNRTLLPSVPVPMVEQVEQEARI